MVHALLSKGYEHTRSIGEHAIYNNFYPRGFHSFVYTISEVFRLEASEVLFTAILIGVSLTIFSAYILISKSKFNNSINTYLILPGAILPYLVMTATYHMFLSQVVVIPFVFAAIFTIPKLETFS